MPGFAVSAGCEGTVFIWIKCGGERVSKNCVIFLNKRRANTFVQIENAVTTLMFYNDTVFSNILTACGQKLLFWHNVTTVMERVCSQTQLCQLRCLMTIFDNYMFRPLLAIFRFI